MATRRITARQIRRGHISYKPAQPPDSVPHATIAQTMRRRSVPSGGLCPINANDAASSDQANLAHVSMREAPREEPMRHAPREPPRNAPGVKMMASGKNTTVERIMELNPTANSEFLAEFSQSDLQRYLERLTDLPFEPAAGSHRTYEGTVDSARRASDRSSPC